jgi:hypothetical protein
MNLFNNKAVLKGVRDKYGLSIPQATAVLIAYSHGSVCAMSIRKVMECDAKTLASSGAIAVPVRLKILVEITKARPKMGSRLSSVYALNDKKTEIDDIVSEALATNTRLFYLVQDYETTNQESMPHEAQ